MLFIFLNYFEHLAHPQMFLQCFYFMILGIYYLVQFLLELTHSAYDQL